MMSGLALISPSIMKLVRITFYSIILSEILNQDYGFIPSFWNGLLLIVSWILSKHQILCTNIYSFLFEIGNSISSPPVTHRTHRLVLDWIEEIVRSTWWNGSWNELLHLLDYYYIFFPVAVGLWNVWCGNEPQDSIS